MPHKDPEVRREYQRKWRSEHHDTMVEATKAWRSTENGKKKRAEYVAKSRKALLSDDAHRWHGTVTGYGFGCRCEPCRLARSVYAAGR